MFKNEVTLLEQENKKQFEGLKEEDKQLINDITKGMTIFKVNSYDAQVIRRDLIGMAQEQNLRNGNLEDSLGDDIKGFTNELIKNSGGPCVIEIILKFLSRLSGYFFIWFLCSSIFFFGKLTWESTPVIYPFYIGVVVITFIIEGVLTPIFTTEKGFRKHLQGILGFWYSLAGALSFIYQGTIPMK